MGIGTGGVTPRSERSEPLRGDPGSSGTTIDGGGEHSVGVDRGGVDSDSADSPPRAAHLDRVRWQRQARGAVSRVPDPDRYDDIVQRLFAVGLAMRATQRRCVEYPDIANRIGDHLNELQAIIIQLRNAGIAESNGPAMLPGTAAIPSPGRPKDHLPGPSDPPSSP